jgi:hypothetical protein
MIDLLISLRRVLSTVGKLKVVFESGSESRIKVSCRFIIQHKICINHGQSRRDDCKGIDHTLKHAPNEGTCEKDGLI